MVDARAKTKTTKRRKVWVTWQSKDGGGGGCGPNLYVDTEKTAGAKPFVEARPGDVVLSREDRSRAEKLLGDVEALTGWGDGAMAKQAGEELRALLRGGR